MKSPSAGSPRCSLDAAHLAWGGMPPLPNPGGLEESAQTFWRCELTPLRTSGLRPHGCGQPLGRKV